MSLKFLKDFQLNLFTLKTQKYVTLVYKKDHLILASYGIHTVGFSQKSLILQKISTAHKISISLSFIALFKQLSVSWTFDKIKGKIICDRNMKCVVELTPQ
jgi:hypothetical protein